MANQKDSQLQFVKEVDYEDISYNNILNQRNKANTRTISYNKIPKPISIYKRDKSFKERNNSSLQQRNEYNQLPLINKSNKKINITSNNYKNRTSFLSKMNGFPVATQIYKTPQKSKNYLQINKNNPNILRISNDISYLNTNFNKSEKVFKKIKISSKKLNIPVVMMDKYTKEVIDKNKISNLNSFNNDDSKINNTENSLAFEKNKMYKLRDILLPRNKQNIDDSILDKQINSFGGESIINYLQSDKNISPSLIIKINNSSKEQLYKLDKICQKYFNDEKIKMSLDKEIRQKIKKEYELDSISCKNDLNNMNIDLKNYNSVYKRLRLKKENYENYKNMYLSHKK